MKEVPVTMTHPRPTLIDAYFGEYGGQYVPEVLYPSLDQLEQAYVDALNDPEFLRELDDLRRNYLGRPTDAPGAGFGESVGQFVKVSGSRRGGAEQFPE